MALSAEPTTICPSPSVSTSCSPASGFARARRQRRIVIAAGRCVLDPLQRTLEVDGEEVSLSNREFQLAHLLMSRAGTVVTRAEALEHVWGSATRDNVLDVYVRYLRSRMGAHAIKTVRGEGYIFVG